MADQSNTQSGGNRSRNSQRNRNRNRSGNRNRSRGGGGNRSSNRGGGGGGGGGGQRRFVKQKVPRRTKPPTLWEKLLSAIGLGGPKRKKPTPAKAKTPAASSGSGSGSGSRNRSGGRGSGGGAKSGGATAKRPKKKAANNNRGGGGGEQRKAARKPEKVDVTTPRLYVGNLSYDTSGDDLEKLFGEIGEVARAEVVAHRRNQRSKGYAFVEMANVDDAKRAVESLHDKDFMGRNIVVSGAKSAGPAASEGEDD